MTNFQTHKYNKFEGYCLCPKEKNQVVELTFYDTHWATCPECEKEFFVDDIAVMCEDCQCETEKIGNHHYKCPQCDHEMVILIKEIETLSMMAKGEWDEKRYRLFESNKASSRNGDK